MSADEPEVLEANVASDTTPAVVTVRAVVEADVAAPTAPSAQALDRAAIEADAEEAVAA